MSYSETLDYLFTRLPMFSKQGGSAFKPGLERISRICDFLGNPENQFKSVHIAGTNGKGSVANMMASVLQEAGYKVGLYTSPHFKDFRERIKVNGTCIPKEKVIAFVNRLKDNLETEPSFFEYSTAMAFQHFAEEKVDIAIIETGLGGRLDSTNVITPLLSVITSISLDHMEFLGSTVEEISMEKAGIIKRGVPVVVGPDKISVLSVFSSVSKDRQAPYYQADIKALDDYQLKVQFKEENIAIAIKALLVLGEQHWKISKEVIQRGINRAVENLGFYGRWFQHPSKSHVYFDVAHNTGGIRYVLQKAREMESFSSWNFVFGMVRDKDHHEVMNLLPKEASYFLCQANVPRALPVDELLIKFQERGFKHLNASATVYEALEKASNSKKNTLVFGSFFVVAEALPEEIFEKFK